RKGQDASLTGRVGGRAGGAVDHGRRGDIDDAAVSGASKQGQGVPASEELAVEVHLELPTPLIVGHIANFSEGADAGDIGQDVEAAESGLHLAHSLDPLGLDSDVEMEVLRYAAAGFDLLDDHSPAVVINIRDDDTGTFSCHHHRRRAADPAGGPRHKGNFVVQSIHLSPCGSEAAAPALTSWLDTRAANISTLTSSPRCTRRRRRASHPIRGG